MLEKILIVLGCLFLAAIIHISIFHFVEFTEKAKTIEIIFAIFFIISIILMFILPDNFIIKDIHYSKALTIAFFANAIILYLLIFHAYIGTYFLIDRSISGRIMIELERKSQIGMTKEELFKDYSGDMIMDRRLDHLVYGKFVSLDNDKYINTTTGTICAKVASFLKKFLNLTEGG